MSKFAPVTVRIDPAIKREAVEILDAYGLTMSQAINIYLHMIILERGLPFDLRPTMESVDAAPSSGVDAGAV